MIFLVPVLSAVLARLLLRRLQPPVAMGLAGAAGSVFWLLLTGEFALDVFLFSILGAAAAGRFAGARERRADAYRGAFVAFFAVFTAAVLVWLAGGLGPGLARAFPALHDQLHSWSGGTQGTIRLGIHDGVCRLANPQIVGGREPTIELFTSDVEDRTMEMYSFDPSTLLKNDSERGDEHDDEGPVIEPLFRSPSVGGPARRVLTVRQSLPPGPYYLWCGNAPATLLTVRPGPTETGVLATIARRIANASHDAPLPLIAAIEYVFSILNLALAIFLVRRRSGDRSGRLLAIGMAGTAAVFNLQAHTLFGITGRTGVWGDMHELFHIASGAAFTFAVALFPDGKLVPRWIKKPAVWLRRAGYVFAGMILAGFASAGAGTSHPAFFVEFFGVLVPVVGIASQGYRLRKPQSAVERRQSRALMVALIPAAVVAITFIVLKATAWAHLRGQQLEDVQNFTFHAFLPVFTFMPAVLLVGILRSQLLGADVALNRTFAFGFMGVFIGAAYVGLVVGIGGALGEQAWISILTTVLVAAAFDPAREWLRRRANRLVYGNRESPYEVMARMARGMSGDDVLPRIVEAAGRGTGALRARIEVRLPDGVPREVTWESPGAGASGQEKVTPVLHGGQSVGEIVVVKSLGDRVSQAEERLLDAMAAQAGLAIEGLRLHARLQAQLEEISIQNLQLAASRRRIATARDAERRRIEIEIRHRVERRLTDITQTLRQAEVAVGDSKPQASALLEVAADGAEEAQETLRDLARGIFPPLLGDRGVVAALEGHIRKLSLDASVLDMLEPSRFDPGAEAAVYFCCVESLKSPAGDDSLRCDVAITTLGGWVEFRVTRHALNAAPPKEGVQAMLDRVEALGGSLEILMEEGAHAVLGRVPAQTEAAAHAAASRSGSNRDFGM